MLQEESRDSGGLHNTGRKDSCDAYITGTEIRRQRTGDDLERKQVKFIFLDSESRAQPWTDVLLPHEEFMPMLQT